MSRSKLAFVALFLSFYSAYAVNPDDYPDFGEKARFIDQTTYDQEHAAKPFFVSIFDVPGDDEWMVTKVGQYQNGEVHLPTQIKSYCGVYGPYVPIPGGLYLGEITITSKPGCSIGKIDLVQRGYSHFQGEKPFQIISKTDIKLKVETQIFRFRFRIPEWRKKEFDTRFEFRFWSTGDHPVIVKKMAIYPAQSTFKPKAPKLTVPVTLNVTRGPSLSTQSSQVHSDEQAAMILQAQEIMDFRAGFAQTDLQQAMMQSQVEF